MTKTSNKKIISKYLDSEASEAEVKQLLNWLEKEKNQITFKNYIKAKLLIDIKFKSFNSQEAVILFLDQIRLMNKNRNKNRFGHWLKYAAVFIAFIGIGYFFVNQNRTSDAIRKQLIISEGDITLELENGDLKIINSKGEEKFINKTGKVIAEQNGNILNYEKENNSKELAYNILTIPNGKKFQIVLSDGTKVHLNAGSSFKYPEKFLNSRNRQVYLLEGEAYFEVMKDAEHPFIVNTDNVNVRVLGTEFNISSYPEDTSINTVLIEGAVSIFSNDKIYDKATSLELKPGFKASWNKTNNNVAVKEVDTDIYTSWKNGKLIFKNIQFNNIIKKLERHYNVTIINNNSKLGKKNYDATFDVETIEEVLSSFNKNYEFEYTIKNNKIIIN
ncbi:MAG TPA: iron dicitrate transport regulator FecR [Lutibacter sp.]|nr:iron dicitrate transport regulator FecR [Lutibacter sp.]